MPIDPSIALQVRPPQFDDPLTVRTKQLQLSDLMNQQRSQQMQFEDAQRQRADQMTLADIYRESQGDAGQTRQLLASRGLGAQIPAFDKANAETSAKLTEADTKKYSLIRDQLDDSNRGMAALLSDPQLTTDKVVQFLASRAQIFPDQAQRLAEVARSLPPDPGQLRQVLMAKAMEGLKAKEQLDLVLPKVETRNMGGTDQVFRTNQMTGEVTPGQSFTKTMTPGEAASNQVALGNLGVSRERLTFEKSQPKGVYDPDRGVLVDPRTGQATQVTMGGQPLPAKPGSTKLTEDQGKATGWLVQANTAYQNMLKAVDADPSAAKPGFGDAIAMAPGGGIAGQFMRGANRQKFNQAASSLSEALLRAATGAGVTKEEAKQKIVELTPQFGDDAATRKQKMDAIPLYIESLKVRAGPGAAQAANITPPVTAPPAARPTPSQGTVDSGYVFQGGDPADPKNWKKQ